MTRMFPGTRALRTFEAAGRHLNFTRAAEEVGLTPAAVSFQIKEIEDQLGITLFTRTSRSIQLTSAGAVLHEAAASALDILGRAALRARKMTRGSAHLRLSVSARFATNWLLPRLPRFKARHPALELTFDITDQLRDFEADDVDAAIRFGTGMYDGARSERLFDAVVARVCSPKLIETSPRLKEPRDLVQHMLCYTDWKTDDMVWPSWRMWMAAAGIEDFDDSQCLAFSDSSHVVQAVIEGGAVGLADLADLAMIGNDIAQGRLVRLFDISLTVGQGYAYHLVYPEGMGDDPRLGAFCDWIIEEAGRQVP